MMKKMIFMLAVLIAFSLPFHAFAEKKTYLRGDFYNLSNGADLSGIDSSIADAERNGGNGFYVLMQLTPRFRLGGGKVDVLVTSDTSSLNFDGGGFVLEFNFGGTVGISAGTMIGHGDAVVLGKTGNTATPDVFQGIYYQTRIMFLSPQIMVEFPAIANKVAPFLIYKQFVFLGSGDYTRQFNSGYFGLGFNIIF